MYMEGIGWYRLADMVSDDIESIGIMIKSFYDKYARKRLDYFGVVATSLYNMYPQVVSQLDPSIIQGLEKIPYMPYNFPDRYEPLNSFSIRSSLPLERVLFIDSEAKLSQMV